IYAAFLAAAAVFIIVCIAREIYPFGTQSVLKIDLYHQYAPYLEEFRSRILSGKSLIYSWETGLGKDFIAQTAYYTTSPLNLLVLFFPGRMISEAVAFLIMLKISLSSASFAYYLREHFERNDISLVIFGLLYAYCAFVTCYYWNFMWLDVVALFPLTALGCEKLILEKKCTLYYIALTLTMIVNFYLSVLVCILITMYAVVIAFTKDRAFWLNQATVSDPRVRPVLLKAAVRFILVSVLCAMTAMIILAPVAAALRETQVSDASFPEFWIYENVWQLLSAHFLGARDAVLARNEDMPNVYCGVLTMVLLPLYYSSRKIPRAEKILYTSFLGLMLLCSCVSTLDFMIHGLHFPANLPHRFSFVYSFILLFMAYRGFCAARKGRTGLRRTVSLMWVYAAAAFYMAVLFVFEYFIAPAMKYIDRVLSGTDLLINLFVIVFYLLLLTWAFRRKKSVPILLTVLLVCAGLETSWSMYENLKDSGDREEYIAWMDDTERAMQEIEAAEKESRNLSVVGENAGNGKNSGDGKNTGEGENTGSGIPFFRTEFRRGQTINDGALYHYNGFSHFSSLCPGGICTLMEHLGVPAAGNSFIYYDTSPLIDAVFDVRYVLSRGEEFPEEDLTWKLTPFRRTGSVYSAKNERVLPIGFMAGEDILDWETIDSEPFEVQNDFVHRAAGTDKNVFRKILPEAITAHNMEVEDVNEVGDEFNYYLEDPFDLASIPWVHAEFIMDRDQFVTLYVDAANAAHVDCSFGDMEESWSLSSGRGVFQIGNMKEGEVLAVDFRLTDRGEFEPSYRGYGEISVFAAGWDDEAFQEAYDRLSMQTLQVESFKDTEIRGRVTAKEDGILFTSIPYTAGWKAFVDGKAAEVIGLGDNGVVGVAVSNGIHEVTLRYRSPLLLPAAFCSLLGLVLFLIYRRCLNTGQK
ncbi:MAG: YfhO family protein, partial [Sarcina sp.]|nr:YfhO family protein [Sarcina sp.]